MFYAGLDLGQAADYTALIIAEQPEFGRYDVRHIERFPLGTPYPQIVEKVEARMAALPEGSRLAVDGTGVGRAVVEMFTIPIVPIAITGGDTVTKDEQWYRVPKRDLVGVVQVLLQTERLKFAAGLASVADLTRELLNFEAKITVTAHDTYGAWREGQHDDLVLSLAILLWYAETSSGPVSAPAAVGGQRVPIHLRPGSPFGRLRRRMDWER